MHRLGFKHDCFCFIVLLKDFLGFDGRYFLMVLIGVGMVQNCMCIRYRRNGVTSLIICAILSMLCRCRLQVFGCTEMRFAGLVVCG